MTKLFSLCLSLLFLLFFFFFSGGGADRASALLCSTLFNNDLLRLKGKQKFKNLTYFHSHVLNRTVLTLQHVLKFSSQRSNIMTMTMTTRNSNGVGAEDSSRKLIESEERSLELLNDDVFFLLLQDMILQRSNEEVWQLPFFYFFFYPLYLYLYLFLYIFLVHFSTLLGSLLLLFLFLPSTFYIIS